MSNIQIVVNGHVDQQSIQDALVTGAYVVDVVNNFRADKEPLYSIDLNDLSSDQQQGILKTIDIATNAIEAGALIWKISKTGKNFNLEDSFIRDSVSTATRTLLIDGTPLKMRVEISAFVINVFREIDLWYNQNFNPADLDLLSEIGIGIVGIGSKFRITNGSPCKVSFSKPGAAADMYVIDYGANDEIITI